MNLFYLCLLLAGCGHGATALRVEVSRRIAITSAGLAAAAWHPLTSGAATSPTDAECEDCRVALPDSDGALKPSSQRYSLGDVISLDIAPPSSKRPELFESAERKMASAIPNPQFEAKRAMYKLAAGEYDVGATQSKLAAMIETTPVLMFSLSS